MTPHLAACGAGEPSRSPSAVPSSEDRMRLQILEPAPGPLRDPLRSPRTPRQLTGTTCPTPECRTPAAAAHDVATWRSPWPAPRGFRWRHRAVPGGELNAPGAPAARRRGVTQRIEDRVVGRRHRGWRPRAGMGATTCSPRIQWRVVAELLQQLRRADGRGGGAGSQGWLPKTPERRHLERAYDIQAPAHRGNSGRCPMYRLILVSMNGRDLRVVRSRVTPSKAALGERVDYPRGKRPAKA